MPIGGMLHLSRGAVRFASVAVAGTSVSPAGPAHAATRSRTFHGEALAIVQPTGQAGRAVISVTSPHLTGDALSLRIG